ncbi:MAG TPA: hypothetical protein DCE41_16135 [Cytophagales bacterium]|nr:hypothetical protein [Cytophagales bacterium]HAA22497.1 hypothetical protein [Cytophagales bacterium]HAP62160.1 hypothetical protein [Cytophagales bacterium]
MDMHKSTTFLRTSLGLFAALMGLLITPALGQEDDDFDDFDPSLYEEAGEVLQAFCTNKVLGQSPTQLLSIGYDFQGPATVTSPEIGAFGAETANWQLSQGLRLVSNVPVLSRNDILINWGVSYVHLGYRPANNETYANPLNANLANHDLKWFNTTFTVFKPLNEKRWILLQASAELNGDYSFSNLPNFRNTRFPIALLYGFKPSDKLMWGFGGSRTYLGGALNYLPIVYYYQTFANDKWGVEAVVPSRINVRYRVDSRNLVTLGYNIEGATYRLSNFNNTPGAAELVGNINETELRRSEIRLGLNYQRGVNDFIYIGVQAGYRINYAFDVDQGEFYRGFNGDDFFMTPGLSNTPYAQVTLSMVSP